MSHDHYDKILTEIIVKMLSDSTQGDTMYLVYYYFQFKPNVILDIILIFNDLI